MDVDEDITDIPSPPVADHTTDDDIEFQSVPEDPGARLSTPYSSPLLASAIANGDGHKVELPEPNAPATGTVVHAEPSQISPPEDQCQPRGLTDQEVAFAITSALAALSNSSSPLAKQDAPPKARRKHGMNKNMKTNHDPESSTEPKKKRQLKIPPAANALGPSKKAKTIEPLKRVSAW